MGHNSDYVKMQDTKNLFRVNNCQVRSVQRTTIEVGKALFTKPMMNKFSPNPRYFKSKTRKEQKKVLNFTRGYFSTSSVKVPATLDDAVKKNPDPGKVSARSSLKKKDYDDVNKNAEGKKKETDNDDEKNENDNVKQEEKEDKETEAEEKKEDNLDDKEGAKENPNPNSMRKFDEMKESRTNRNELKLFRKFVIEI